MITLYNVTDIRDGRHYSIAIINQRKAKYFIPDGGDGGKYSLANLIDSRKENNKFIQEMMKCYM